MQLCKVLYLDEFPLANKPVDPSIFIAKFSDSLLGGRDKGVIQTAVRIITSMKRNGMQTGRKPSGLCGATLYISALSHGLKCSKSDFLRIAHVCDATLTKRLIEFENTESGSLTIEEFHLKETELDELCEPPRMAVKMDGRDDILCEHKDSGKPFAHGLCKICYDDLMTISGGLHGGSNPPAFQRAKIERRKKASAQENAIDSDVDTSPCQSLDNSKQSNFETEVNYSRSSENGRIQSMGPKSAGAPMVNTAIHTGAEACDESDNLSDIDDEKRTKLQKQYSTSWSLSLQVSSCCFSARAFSCCLCVFFHLLFHLTSKIRTSISFYCYKNVSWFTNKGFWQYA